MHLNSIITTAASLVLLVVATSSSSFDTSTCAHQSIAACPTAYDPCCAFVCAEAQVPFDVCSPNNQTVLASCSQCTYPATTKTSTTPKTTTSAPKTTTPPPITKTSSSSFDTSTCSPKSIAACPTAYDPCCAFICAEAQVPFDVCSPDNRTVLASCSKCTYPATTKTTAKTTAKTTPKSTTKKTPKTTTKTTAKSTTKTTAKSTTAKSTTAPKTTLTTTASASFPFPTSTCTGRLLSTAGCPTPYDHCCQYVCEEAQVPFDVCSLTNGSGEFAVCTSCPSPTPT